MKIVHKTPCNECPWRRKHPPGWLGGYDISEFINQVQFDGPPLPCHKTSNFGDDYDPSTDDAHFCAGALIFMKNSCKSAQHPLYGNALDHVDADRENVFHFPQEFRDHHSGDIVQKAADMIGKKDEE